MENWRYKARAITKYIPKNYNSEGVYIYNEWTSRSDIGKKKDSVTNAILTQERYLEVEDNYINSVKILMRETGAETIKVIELYKISDEDDFKRWNDMQLLNFYNELDEKLYNFSEIDLIIRLVLREYIQVTLQLITQQMDTTVHFGFDYYMYFVSDSVDFISMQNELINKDIYII